MGGISNLDLFTPYKRHGLTYRCIGVTTTVGTYLPQEQGAGAAHTQCAVVLPPGECQLLTSGDIGDESDDEDDVLRGAEAECYSRVSVSFRGPFCPTLCPQLLLACLGWWWWWWVSMPRSKLGLSLFSFSKINPSPSQ